MPKPILLAIDDDPQVLGAVERDLRRHYRSEYRILKASSGTEGLELVRQLKQRQEALALFLVDQRMPHMTGAEFLEQAMVIYPQARKVLLTAYADTQAAIRASIGRPRLLPDEALGPARADSTRSWTACSAVLPGPAAHLDGFRVAGSLWSRRATRSRISWRATASPTCGWIWSRTPWPAELVDPAGQPGAAPTAARTGCRWSSSRTGRRWLNQTFETLADKAGLRTVADPAILRPGGRRRGACGPGGGRLRRTEGLRTLMIDSDATGGRAGSG